MKEKKYLTEVEQRLVVGGFLCGYSGGQCACINLYCKQLTAMLLTPLPHVLL